MLLPILSDSQSASSKFQSINHPTVFHLLANPQYSYLAQVEEDLPATVLDRLYNDDLQVAEAKDIEGGERMFVSETDLERLFSWMKIRRKQGVTLQAELPGCIKEHVSAVEALQVDRRPQDVHKTMKMAA